MSYGAEVNVLADTIQEKAQTKRSNEQNRFMWSMLADFSQQKKWIVNGRECLLDPTDWKDLLTASYKNDIQRIAQGINGGIVLLGARTSKMKVEEMNEFITYCLATGAEMGIKFKAPEWR